MREEISSKTLGSRRGQEENEQLLSCWARWLWGRMREALEVLAPRALWLTSLPDAKHLRADRPALLGQPQA